MLTAQACSRAATGHFTLVLNPLVFPRMINSHSVVFMTNTNVFVDAALAKLHRAKVSMKANR